MAVQRLRTGRSSQFADSGSGHEAATFVVSPTPGVGDYTTIQAALDALPSGGGYILIREGDYNENLTLHNNVILKGCGRGATNLNIGSVDNTAAFSIPAGSLNVAIRDMSIVGDPTKNQTLLSVDDDAFILFENIESTDILTIVANGSEAEVTFNYCTLNMPNVTEWSIWDGLHQSGALYWNDVELNVTTDSTRAMAGQPDWTVTASYSGSGPTYSTYDIGTFTVQGFRIDGALLNVNTNYSRIVNLNGSGVKFVWLGDSATMTGSYWSNSDGNPGLNVQGFFCVVSGCRFDGSGGSVAVVESGGADSNKYGPNLGFGGSTITGTSSVIVGPKFAFTVSGAVTDDASTNDAICAIPGTGDVVDTLQAFARTGPVGSDLEVEFFIIDLTTGATDSSIGTATIADGDKWSGRTPITPVAIPTDKGILMQVNSVGSGTAGSNLTGTAS